MRRDTNDLLDEPAPEHRATCRITGWTGLEERRAPLDAAVFPQALLEWASAAANGQTRHAGVAPAIYCVGVNETSPTRLIVASQSLDTGEQRDRAVTTAQHRLVPATYAPAQDQSERSVADRPRQCALTPRQISTLGHLLAHVKYPLLHSHVRSEKSSPTGFHLVFNAGAMIDRLGYARGGDAYTALENDLAALAQFIVRHEKRDEHHVWKTARASALISRLATGRCSVAGGVRHDTDNVRRDEQWLIEFGAPMQAMMDVNPADLSVIGGGLWSAAGRSRIDQWLALWVAGHGYDQNQVHDYRVETLGRRMRLLPDALSRALAPSSGTAKPAARNGGWTPSPAIAVESAGDSLSEREALTRARGYWRQIQAAVNRLESRNALKRADWTHQQNAPDVRPSQAGRAVSRTDLVKLTRWAGVVEGVLPRARRWVRRQWGDLLSSVNRSFSTLRELTKHGDANVAEWASALHQNYTDKMQWLSAGGRIAEAALTDVKTRMSHDLYRARLFFEQASQPQRFSVVTDPRYMTG